MIVVFVKKTSHISVPDDFLVLAASAIVHLRHSGRSNVLYQLAKSLGIMRADEPDSRFFTKRMPMGLVEYAADFLAADSLQLVGKVCSNSNFKCTQYHA